ncbi:MAG: UDP-N-acetylmuramoyl-L-alanine--D-glutamate ligase [Mariprofundales bacterium]|nr:UDP-N-acetylmuramoyl-L-alanine--D-glutamate ligase [Mariprofundales bacterium]
MGGAQGDCPLLDHLDAVGADCALYAEDAMRSAILGMGVTGQSVARYLRTIGEECCCFDEGERDNLTADVVVAPFDAALFATFDRVVVSPGISWNHAVLQQLRNHAQEHGRPELVSDLDLFTANYQGELMAVTGTNGKTTVTHLLGVLLETLAGGVEVGGNIGQPMLDLLGEARRSPRVVLELSSFQLERSRPPHASWAALLNIQEDHVDMHRSSVAYRIAKERIFVEQRAGDYALLPVDGSFDRLAHTLQERGVVVRRFGIGDGVDVGICGDHLCWYGSSSGAGGGELCRVPLADLKIHGQHQQCNLAVAAQGAADCGVHTSVIVEGLISFRGLAHRLQWVARIADHDWFNDSKATNPAAAAAALVALDRAVWICGGVTKGVDLSPLRSVVRDHVPLMVVIGRESAPFVALADSADVAYEVADSMEQAVYLAATLGQQMPVVLSPAAASFDQFANYAARGDAFVAAVRGLCDA